MVKTEKFKNVLRVTGNGLAKLTGGAAKVLVVAFLAGTAVFFTLDCVEKHEKSKRIKNS